MPRVKIPRSLRLLNIKLQGSAYSTNAPVKSVAVRKLSVGQGAVIQNKAGAYTQLQESSNQNKYVSGTGLRGLLIDRPGSFAAAPYLLRRELHHGAAAAYVRPPSQSLPSPSFASRPVWKSEPASMQVSPEERRQAAINARLARLPLYAYAQVTSKRGVQKQRHAQRRRVTLDPSQKQGLRWYETLASDRAAPRQRIVVTAGRQAEGLKWYGRLDSKSAM